ncbi:MAG TPA: hypothetical protein VKS24_18005 [Bradyrhizobium sp.]|nr:hypothetical protein [Bradyrhizobium sp.]
MTKLQQLEKQLTLMRREVSDYALDGNHGPFELINMRSECAALWGAIECFEKGTTPVQESQSKYLR